MKKFLKALKIIGLILLVLIVIIVFLIVKERIDRAADQKMMPKTDEELIGEHFYVTRDGKDPVDVNLYIPETGERLPIVFNIHGGAFVAGDADTLDTQSNRLSRNWNAVIVTINYKLAKDGISIDYGTEEIVDTVKYFIAHADEYPIDTSKIVMLGYSAGGCHAMISTLLLKQENIDVGAQILCYPFISNAVEIYDTLTEQQKVSVAPALFILADGDPISDGSLTYEAVLRENNVQTEVKKYEKSIHGFIEENNPEYEKLRIVTSKSPEQEQMARDAEDYMYRWLADIFSA